MQSRSILLADHEPAYYLGVQIRPDGTIAEVFNGPGAVAGRAVKGRAIPKTNLHSVPITALKKLQAKVLPGQTIPRRSSQGSKRVPTGKRS